MPIDPSGIKWDDAPPAQPQAPAIDPNGIQWDQPANDLHARQMQVESNGDQSAVSPKGATGRMQIMPKTGPEAARFAGVPWDPVRFKNDGDYNELLGKAYQDHQEKTFGDTKLGLAAYNAGPGAVAKLIGRVGDPSKGQVSWNDFAAHLPQETRDYVQKIAGATDSTLGELGRVSQSAIKQGVAIPANLGADIYRGLEQVARAPYEDIANMFGTTLDEAMAPVSKYLPDHSPAEYAQQFAKWLTDQRAYDTPKTEVGKIDAQLSGTGLGAIAVPLPGMGLVSGAGTRGVYGALSSAGSQIGSQVTGGSPVGAVIGGLAVPATVSGIETMLPTSVKQSLAGIATKDLTPNDFAQSRAAMQADNELGVHTTFGQTLPVENNALGLEQILSQSPEGTKLLAQLRQQPQEIANASKAFQQGLPGQTLIPREANNLAQETATGVIKQADQFRQSQVGPLMQNAGDIPTEMAKGIIQDLKQQIKPLKGTTKGDLLQSLVNNLQISKPLVDASGQQIGTKLIPKTNINAIHEVLKSEAIPKPNFPTDSGAAGLLTSNITKIKNQLGEVNPTFAQGLATHQDISQQINNPLRQGPVGAVAGTSGYQEMKQAPEKILGIFDKGTPIDPKTGRPLPSDILQLQRQFSSTGPEGSQAFTNIGASWIASRFNKAIQLDSGRPVSNVASNIEQQFFGTDAKVQGFKDTLAGIARSSGVDEKTIVDGGTNYMRTIQRAANVKSVGSGVSEAQVQGAQQTAIGAAGRLNAVQPFRMPALWLQRLLGGNAEKEVSEMFLTPEGISKLEALSKVQPGSQAAMKIIGIGSNAMNQSQPTQDGGQ